jgi:hypothetical protein
MKLPPPSCNKQIGDDVHYAFANWGALPAPKSCLDIAEGRKSSVFTTQATTESN